MFSRTHGPKKRLFAQKPSAESKIVKANRARATRFSDAEGFKEEEKQRELARLRIIRDWYKDSIYYYNPVELRDDPGTVPIVETKPTCPHKGNKSPFSFIFCKPDCPRTSPLGVLSVIPGTSDQAVVDRCVSCCNKGNSSPLGSNEGQKASEDLKDKLELPYVPTHISIPKGWVCGPPGLDAW